MSVVVCIFEFGMVSKWCVREWVNKDLSLFTPKNEVWGGGGILGSPCPSIMKSCLGHNFKSIKASNFKLHTQIGHIVIKCSVQ